MVHHDCRLGDVQRQSVDGWGNWGFAVLRTQQAVRWFR